MCSVVFRGSTEKSQSEVVWRRFGCLVSYGGGERTFVVRSRGGVPGREWVVRMGERRMEAFVGLPVSRVLSRGRSKGAVLWGESAQWGDRWHTRRATRVVMLSNVIERIKANTNLEKLAILTNSDLIEMSEEGNR